MKKITKWRFLTVIVLSGLGILAGIFSYLISPENLPLLIIIFIIIEGGCIRYIDKYLITPKLKEVEDKEKIEIKQKEKEKEDIDRYKSLKKMILLQKKYEDVKDSNLKEMECTQELGDLFPELLKIGFRYSSDQKTTVKDKNYEVIFKPLPKIITFLIRKLENGMRGKEPFEQYLSKKYSASAGRSDRQVLYDFIDYITEILGIKRKDPIQIVLDSFFTFYKKSPSALIMGEGMLDVINSKLGVKSKLNEAELISALEHLESKGVIKQDKVLETDIPHNIKVLPRIVDFVKNN